MADRNLQKPRYIFFEKFDIGQGKIVAGIYSQTKIIGNLGTCQYKVLMPSLLPLAYCCAYSSV